MQNNLCKNNVLYDKQILSNVSNNILEIRQLRTIFQLQYITYNSSGPV